MRYISTLLAIGALFMALARGTPVKSEKVDCDSNGTANQQIGCIDNANAHLREQLSRHYSHYLDSIFETCAKDNPGGGSGGHEDRAICARSALKAEAIRVNLEK